MKKEFLDLYMILSVLAGVIGIFISQLLIKINLYLMILSVITGILALKYKGFLTFIFIYFLFYCVDVFFF